MSISNVYIWLGKLGILVILNHSHLKEQLFLCGLKKVKEWEILVAEKGLISSVHKEKMILSYMQIRYTKEVCCIVNRSMLVLLCLFVFHVFCRLMFIL